MTQALLALGCDPSLPDGWGFPPLVAAAAGNLENFESACVILDLLLEAKANPHSAVGSLTALECAARGGNAAAVRRLAAGGADATGGGAKYPPLYYGILSGDVETVTALLDGGAVARDVKFGDEQLTPLMCAAQVGDIYIGRLLLGHGAAADEIGGEHMWTALHEAATRGRDLFYKWLRTEVMADTTIRDSRGRLASEMKTPHQT